MIDQPISPFSEVQREKNLPEVSQHILTHGGSPKPRGSTSQAGRPSSSPPQRPLIFTGDLPIIDKPLPRFLDDAAAAKRMRFRRVPAGARRPAVGVGGEDRLPGAVEVVVT